MSGPHKPGSQHPMVPAPVDDTEPERRRELRVPIRVLRVETELNGEVFFGYAINMSTTGMFIQTSNPKNAGMQVRLSFAIPTGTTVECRAEVIWKHDYAGGRSPSPGMGLRFVDLSAEAAETIRKFVDET